MKRISNILALCVALLCISAEAQVTQSAQLTTNLLNTQATIVSLSSDAAGSSVAVTTAAPLTCSVYPIITFYVNHLSHNVVLGTVTTSTGSAWVNSVLATTALFQNDTLYAQLTRIGIGCTNQLPMTVSSTFMPAAGICISTPSACVTIAGYLTAANGLAAQNSIISFKPSQLFWLASLSPGSGEGGGGPDIDLVNFQHNGVFVGAQNTLDFEDNDAGNASGGVTWTVSNDDPNGRVKTFASIYDPLIPNDSVQLGGQSYTVITLPHNCNSAYRDSFAVIIDSTTDVQGAIVSGGGAFRVGAWCDGSDWRVFTGRSAAGLINAEWLAPIFDTNCSFAQGTCSDIVFSPMTASLSRFYGTPDIDTLGLPYMINPSGGPECHDYTGTQSTSVCPFAEGLQGGNVAFVCAEADLHEMVGVTDTLGNTWGTPFGFDRMWCSIAKNSKKGNDIVTVDFGANTGYTVTMGEEVGADKDFPIDTTVNGGVLAGGTVTWTVTTSQPDGITIASGGGGVAGLGWSHYFSTDTTTEELQWSTYGGAGLGASHVNALSWGNAPATGVNTLTTLCTPGLGGICIDGGVLIAWKPSGPNIPTYPSMRLLKYQALQAGGDFPDIAGQGGKAFIVDPTGTMVALSSFGSGTVTTTGSPASGNLTKFSGPTSVTNGDLSGDVTTSGTLATTVGKVNGVSYSASPGTNTVPVVTGSNTTTYETVPNAALANSATTVNGQTCTLGSTCNVNAGNAAHSVAINEGNGSQFAAVLLALDQVLSGATSADPVPLALPNCPDSGGQHWNYSTSTHVITCGTTGGSATSVPFSGITTGVNTQPATMTAGNGSTITFSGTGVVNANQFNGNTKIAAADLSNTAVTPASYTSMNATVDAQGRITAASNGSSGPSATYGGLIGGYTGGGSCVSAPWWPGCSSTAANHMQSFPSFWSKLTQHVLSAGTPNNGYVNQFEASSITAGQNFQNTTADYGRLVTGPVSNGVSYQEQAGVAPFNVVAGAYSYLKESNTLNGNNGGGATGGWSAITVGTTAQPYDWILSNTFALSSTHYSGPGYKVSAAQTTEALAGIVMPLAGTFDYQCLISDGVQPGTGSLVQTLDRTAAGVTTATSVVTTFTSSNTNGNDNIVCDLTHSQAVTEGDYYTWSWVNSASSASTEVRSTSMRFTPTTPKQTAIVWPLGTQIINASNYASQAFATGVTSASNVPIPMPLSGTMDNLYCLLTTAPGTNPQAVTVYLDGVATALTLSLPTAGCTNSICSDLTHSFSFTALQGISLFFGAHTGSAPAVSSCSARITWN